MAWNDRHDVVELVRAADAAGFEGVNSAIAAAVAMAESGGRMVVNRDAAETPESLRGVDRCVSVGPWQINYCPTRDRGTIRERAANDPRLELHVVAAKQVHAEQGWNAWTEYRNGGWREHIDAAEAAMTEATGRGTDDSLGAAIGDTASSLSNPLGMFTALASVLADPRRLGYLALGLAVGIVAVVLIVKESGIGNAAGLIPHPAAQAAAAVTGD